MVPVAHLLPSLWLQPWQAMSPDGLLVDEATAASESLAEHWEPGWLMMEWSWQLPHGLSWCRGGPVLGLSISVCHGAALDSVEEIRGDADRVMVLGFSFAACLSFLDGKKNNPSLKNTPAPPQQSRTSGTSAHSC